MTIEANLLPCLITDEILIQLFQQVFRSSTYPDTELIYPVLEHLSNNLNSPLSCKSVFSRKPGKFPVLEV